MELRGLQRIRLRLTNLYTAKFLRRVFSMSLSRSVSKGQYSESSDTHLVRFRQVRSNVPVTLNGLELRLSTGCCGFVDTLHV
jgi:hypothetical protein